MVLTWLGTASLLVQCGGCKLLFDPYLHSLNKRISPFPYELIEDCDGIFITHGHLDHFADLPRILERTSCPVYVGGRSLELAKSNGFDISRLVAVKAGDEITIGGVSIRAYRGKHVAYDAKCVLGVVARSLFGHLIKAIKLACLNKRFKIGGEDILFFGVNDGQKTALVMGSANIHEEEKYPPADILVYPYQGRSDMQKYSLNLLRSLAPKTVLLDHFDDAFPPITHEMNAEKFAKAASDDGLKIVIPGLYGSVAF